MRIGVMCARMAAAAPATSSTVSPLVGQCGEQQRDLGTGRLAADQPANRRLSLFKRQVLPRGNPADGSGKVHKNALLRFSPKLTRIHASSLNSNSAKDGGRG